MKNLILAIVSVLTVNTINAQLNDMAYFDASNKSLNVNKLTSNVTPVLGANFNYLNNVNSIESSNNVLNIEQLIANYDLKKTAIYDSSEKATYEVTFKKRNSKAVVTYNNDGKIIKSIEKYKNVNIPFALKTKILKENPEFGIFGTNVLITFSNSNNVNVIYKIKIRNGNDRRILKFNKEYLPI